MTYYRRSKTIEAIVWNGYNLEEVKNFLKEKYEIIRVFEDKHLFLMLHGRCYAAQIGDYIVNEEYSYTMTKQTLEENYINK